MARRCHSVGGTPRACADAAVALQWVRHGAFARTPRLELFGANPLRTIAPESLRMMVWSFWAADARSEWVAWLRRTAALLPRPRGGQQRCVEGGSSREVVLQRVRPAGRRALMSCLQLLTWSPVLGASGSAGQHGRVPALWVHHDDEGAWRACAELCGSFPSVNLYPQEPAPRMAYAPCFIYPATTATIQYE